MKCLVVQNERIRLGVDGGHGQAEDEAPAIHARRWRLNWGNNVHLRTMNFGDHWVCEEDGGGSMRVILEAFYPFETLCPFPSVSNAKKTGFSPQLLPRSAASFRLILDVMTCNMRGHSASPSIRFPIKHSEPAGGLISAERGKTCPPFWLQPVFVITSIGRYEAPAAFVHPLRIGLGSCRSGQVERLRGLLTT